MPSVVIPPWLQPVDQVGPFMQGMTQGVSMARIAADGDARARELAFSAQKEAADVALRQQAEERRVLEAVGQVMEQKARAEYESQQIKLRAKQAARQFEAQDEAQRRVKSGEDPAKVYMELAGKLKIQPGPLMPKPSAQIMRVPTPTGESINVIAQPSGHYTQIYTEEQRQQRAKASDERDVNRTVFQTQLVLAKQAQGAAQSALRAWMSKQSNQEMLKLNEPTALETRTNLERAVTDAEKEVERISKAGLQQFPEDAAPAPAAAGKPLTDQIALEYLRKAGGDVQKATDALIRAGYDVSQ